MLSKIVRLGTLAISFGWDAKGWWHTCQKLREHSVVGYSWTEVLDPDLPQLTLHHLTVGSIRITWTVYELH